MTNSKSRPRSFHPCADAGIHLLTLLGMLVLLSGCRRSNNAPAQNSTQLNYAQIDEPRKLDPAFVKDLYEGIVSGFLYDGLVVFGKGAEVEPGLAERWEISPDGRTYTFHLRDAKFSDGKAVTSADVRYSFTRILKAETLSDRKWVLDRIVGAQEVTSGTATELAGLATPDARTVVITLQQPYPVFLTMLAMPNAAIIPEGSAGIDKPDPNFNQKPIGSGPWMLTKWVHDQRLEFERNPHFWSERPRLERLVYHIQLEDQVRRAQFESGKHDLYQIGFQAHEAYVGTRSSKYETTSVQELRTDYIGIMCHKPQLSDKRLRQAIARAIDRDTIFEKLQKGRGVLAHGVVPPGTPGYRNDLPLASHSTSAARELLQQVGAANLKLDLWFRQEPLNSEIASQVQSDLQAAGLQVTLVPRDQASLRMGIHEGQADLFLGSWTLDYPDMENALYPPFHSRNIPRQGNGSHFSNAEVDALLDRARSEADPQARIALYQQVEDHIREECPWVPLFHRRTFYAVQPNVRGFTPALMYNADRFTDVTKL